MASVVEESISPVPYETRATYRLWRGEEFTETEKRQETVAAFENEWDWVVPNMASGLGGFGEGGETIWLAYAIGNLHRRSGAAELATVSAVREAIVAGLEKQAFERLKSLLSVSGDQLCAVVGIPSRTVARRTVFKPDESERILRVAVAFQKTFDVFEEVTAARDWFLSSKRALGGMTPFAFCDTEAGASEVRNLLGRIEHGVFA